jgi:hypothetical protein
MHDEYFTVQQNAPWWQAKNLFPASLLVMIYYDFYLWRDAMVRHTISLPERSCT